MASPGGAARKKSARRPGAGGGPSERTGEASAPGSEKPAAAREGTASAEGEKRPARKPMRPVGAPPVATGGFKARLEEFVRFLKSVRAEMKRVTWPGMKEVRAATIVVVMTLVLIAGFMGIVDWLLTKMFGTPVVSGY